MTKASYAIALGSNRRHGRYGGPRTIIAAALDQLSRLDIEIVAAAPVIETPALGPAGRRFANGAAIIETRLQPPELLAELKALERAFGRRRGRRWGPRVIDLDIILWSGGRWSSPELVIPHPQFRVRSFVLDPLSRIAPLWHDPVSGLAIRQLYVRKKIRRPVDHLRSAP